MNSQRPIFLNLTQLKFPRMAIVSILHRISGVVMFLALPLLLYLLHQSLYSQTSFVATQQLLAKPLMILIMWGVLSAVVFHILAGIRHLIMDCGYFESLRAGRMTATLVLILAAIATVLLGVWLW